MGTDMPTAVGGEGLRQSCLSLMGGHSVDPVAVGSYPGSKSKLNKADLTLIFL
ncbi:hypothetical protein GCM10007893_28860 [Paracoccus marinus]|nr:hypothetical protein GCM10007893_28860 [Paracoccus marinus]